MSKNVIQITEYDGFSDEFHRSYLLNNLEKGGIVFSKMQTSQALARIGQLNTTKKIHVDVYDLATKMTDLSKVY
ncbi:MULTISPECIES: hypothetical protein [unclassified Enterococcus]|uniref:hypothetical protein n=1 Tax=unclassified Enterococcus TaxID=2608891 RepID=UPI000A32FB93|nr:MULTISPECIES: hypothetical protein [unclassified Enterococcus]OTO71294.1 hypothetical protein A5865_002990 [Enterococcus sp. 12E11_DIV0728]OUZ15330.1 hypothetical protein A5868_000238 [Enterococcus sp. 12F9_DIV0723]